MGTWGAGNFDSDGALDFVGSQITRLINVIEAVMADGERFQLDEDGESMLIPSVAILALLCEHCHGVLPRELAVAAWKQRYLRMFDEQIGGLEPAAGFEQERRAVIAATFDHLLGIHTRRWDALR